MAQLVKQVADDCGSTIPNCRRVTENMFEIIGREIGAGNTVVIEEFGRFRGDWKHDSWGRGFRPAGKRSEAMRRPPGPTIVRPERPPGPQAPKLRDEDREILARWLKDREIPTETRSALELLWSTEQQRR